MNKTQRFRALLEAGYFPEELPPPFNTRHIAVRRKSITSAWAARSLDYPKTTHETYSAPKVGRVRRNLSIVNPIAQLNLAKLIADNWQEIRNHLRKSVYSMEPLEIRPDGMRAVAVPDRRLLSLRRAEIASHYDCALQSDISRFYSTLYTHALPWAMHTKTWCKRNLNTPIYNSALGAQLDRAVRKGQDNQTIGIPVGPDTSRILSEIVAVALDENIQNALGVDPLRAFRYVDDWHIGFDSTGEAEGAIAVLAASARDYELELNSDKTLVVDAKARDDRAWPAELRRHHFPDLAIPQRRSLEDYSAKAFHYASAFPDDNVLGYAVRRTRTICMQSPNWHFYETFLLRAVRVNQTVLPSVVEILVSYNADGFALGKERIGKLIQDLIEINAPPAHHAEVAWAMFLAKALRIKLLGSSAQAVSGIESSVCGLLAMDLDKRELVEGSLNTDLWRQSMTPEGLRSSMWLLAYEADSKGWLEGVLASIC